VERMTHNPANYSG